VDGSGKGVHGSVDRLMGWGYMLYSF